MSASPPATDSPTSRKRTYDEIDGRSPSKDPVMTQSSLPTSTQLPSLPTPPTAYASTPASTTSSRLTSPAPSSSADSVSRAAPSTGAPPATSEKLTLPTAPKKRKLTPAERETKRLEKEAKDREKAEEKARKDEARRVQDEERRRKREAEEEEKRKREFDKAEKKKVRDAEVAKKEEEKRKKEEEKNKKEKSQLRLNSFFTKPAPNQASPASADSSRRNSIDLGQGQDFTGSVAIPPSPIKPTVKTTVSDYQKSFPPFYLQSHVSLAPQSRFTRDEEALNFSRAKIDSHLKEIPHSLSEGPPSFNAFDLFRIVPHRRGVDKGVSASVKDIVQQAMQGSAMTPIDLTRSAGTRDLTTVTMKVLHFREDVRPPYQGTFTKAISARSASKLARNPFHRALPDTNYDYDSEAEWEEPEEGEELDSEGEEDASEDGEEDMDGFLDDEDDMIRAKRRPVVGDLEPCNSGLCWEDTSRGWKIESNSDIDLDNYRMEVILDSAKAPIDPFSTKYWPSKQPITHAPRAVDSRSSASSAAMNPPRVPLHAINQTHAINNATHPPIISESEPSTKPVPASNLAALPQQSKAAAKPKRMIADDLLPQFKQAVEGSNLTKAGLIEVMKKQFPKVSKDCIKDTLNAVAIREGRNETDKRWVIIAAQPGQSG